MFTYLFDGFQRRFSTPSMSKPTKMRPKRQIGLRIKHHHQHYNGPLPKSQQPPDQLRRSSRGIFLSPAHESHHDLYRTRVLPRVIFSLLRWSINFSMIDARRLGGSSSFNPFAKSQSRHDGSRSAVFKQLLVILTACPYLPDIYNQKNNNNI